MIISITIDPTVESTIIQNIAIAKGWTSVTDEEARQKLGKDFKDEMARLAIQGEDIKRRKAEQQQVKSDTASKITVV